jgi:hypothetical protein
MPDGFWEMWLTQFLARQVKSGMRVIDVKRGSFQPAVKIVAGAVGVSTKTVFTHFGSVEGLRCNALEDEATRAAVAHLVIGTEEASLSISTRDRVLRAVALGLLPEIESRPTK